MKISNKEYAQLVKERSPNSVLARNMVRAFISGGVICAIGQGIMALWQRAGVTEENAAIAESVTLVFLGVLLTVLGLYEKIAKFAGAGTLVPITGFANSIAAPAIEFKTEGFVTGTAVKMFSIAGPVIVYGTAAGVLYGVVLMLMERL